MMIMQDMDLQKQQQQQLGYPANHYHKRHE
jgi:hypothetical protein